MDRDPSRLSSAQGRHSCADLLQMLSLDTWKTANGAPAPQPGHPKSRAGGGEQSWTPSQGDRDIPPSTAIGRFQRRGGGPGAGFWLETDRQGWVGGRASCVPRAARHVACSGWDEWGRLGVRLGLKRSDGLGLGLCLLVLRPCTGLLVRLGDSAGMRRVPGEPGRRRGPAGCVLEWNCASWCPFRGGAWGSGTGLPGAVRSEGGRPVGGWWRPRAQCTPLSGELRFRRGRRLSCAIGTCGGARSARRGSPRARRVEGADSPRIVVSRPAPAQLNSGCPSHSGSRSTR